MLSHGALSRSPPPPAKLAGAGSRPSPSLTPSLCLLPCQPGRLPSASQAGWRSAGSARPYQWAGRLRAPLPPRRRNSGLPRVAGPRHAYSGRGYRPGPRTRRRALSSGAGGALKGCRRGTRSLGAAGTMRSCLALALLLAGAAHTVSIVSTAPFHGPIRVQAGWGQWGAPRSSPQNTTVCARRR